MRIQDLYSNAHAMGAKQSSSAVQAVKILKNKRAVIDICMNEFETKTFSGILKTFASKEGGCRLLEEATDLKKGIVTFSYKVPPSLCRVSTPATTASQKQVLTCSAALAVLDELSTYSFLIKDANTRGGVSVHLSVELLGDISANEDVNVVCTSDKVGKTIGFCSMDVSLDDVVSSR